MSRSVAVRPEGTVGGPGPTGNQRDAWLQEAVRDPLVSPEVKAYVKAVKDFYKLPVLPVDGSGGSKSLGKVEYAVYALYGYADEPLYVGQTREGVSARLGRHLTGRRSDIVANELFDPNEVIYIKVWPLRELESLNKSDAKHKLDAAECTLSKLVGDGQLHGPYNQHTPAGGLDSYKLPEPFKCVLPNSTREPNIDARLARRCASLARLSRLISERNADADLRRVFMLRAQSVAALAEGRYGYVSKRTGATAKTPKAGKAVAQPRPLVPGASAQQDPSRDGAQQAT